MPSSTGSTNHQIVPALEPRLRDGSTRASTTPAIRIAIAG